MIFIKILLIFSFFAQMAEKYKVVVIGSGPAAYMASIYTKTANLAPLLVKEETSETHNFTGYDKVIGVLNVNSQSELLKLANDQINDFGIKTKETKVMKLDYDSGWKIHLENEIIFSTSVIIDDKIIFERCFGEKNCDLVDSLSKKGLFICGNLTEKYSEAIVLFASGCVSSFEVQEYLG